MAANGRVTSRLSVKIAVVIAGFMAIVFAVVTPVIVTTVTNQTKQALVNQTKSFTVLATQPIGNAFLTYRDSGTTLLTERVRSTAELYVAIQNVQVVDVQGSNLFELKSGSTAITQKDAQTFEPIFQFDENGFLNRVIYPFIEESRAHRYTVVYDVSATELTTSLQALRNRIIAVALVTLLVIVVLLTLLFELWLVRPLNRMSQVALAIKAGQLQRSIRIKRRDEIGDLALSINAMADTLQSDIEKLAEADKLKSEFLIISSHNLRTPLSVINGYIELVGEANLDAQTKANVAIITDKAKDLTDLINDMLMVAELEGGTKPRLHKRPANLVDLLGAIQPELKQQLAQKNLRLDWQMPDNPVMLTTQKTYLQTVVWNLLDNAIKFTPEGGTVGVELKQFSDEIYLTVRDTGKGISDEEKPKLFTKFHRGTSIMKYEYEGIGLGLYMSKLMVELLGGTITVESHVGKGSTFTVTLPKN